MNIPQTEAYGSHSTSDDELLEAIGSVLDSFRLSAEFKDRSYPDKWAVTDILKAFLLYSNGNISSRTLMSDDLDNLLSESNSCPDISGFHMKRPASRIVRGLAMLSGNISRNVLLLALVKHLYGISCSTECPTHIKDLILGENASGAVVSMVTSEKVILDHPYLDLIARLSPDYAIQLKCDDEIEIAECVSCLIDNVTLAENSAPDSDIIIRAKYMSSFPNSLEELVNNLPEDRMMIILDDCDLLEGDRKISRRSLDVLDGKMPSLCKFISFFPDRHLTVAVVSGRCSDTPTRICVFSENCETGLNAEMTETPDSPSDDRTVRIGEIASVRKGVIVHKEDLVTNNDDGNAMYIRPKDVKNGGLVLDNISYIVKDDFDSVATGSILVDSYPPFTRSYLVRDDDVPCVASPNFSVVTPNSDYLPDYVHAFFRSSMFLEDAQRKSSGKFITLASLKSIRIPVAPKDVQSRIVNCISTVENDPERITAAFKTILSDITG